MLGAEQLALVVGQALQAMVALAQVALPVLPTVVERRDDDLRHRSAGPQDVLMGLRTMTATKMVPIRLTYCPAR